MRIDFLALTAALLACGCSDLLTPEKVREHLENPTAAVDDGTMGQTARDFFAAQRVSAARDLAFFTKGNSGETSNLAAAWAAGDDSMRRGISFAGGTDANDIWCAGGLAASLVAFDSCEQGDDCEAEITIDSCLLRIGDGDENAKGRIVFKLKNSVDGDIERTELRLTFEDFEVSGADDTTDYFDGLLAVETSEHTDRDEGAADRVEVVLAADLTQQSRRVERFPIFDDGKISSTRATAGLRFTANDDDTEQNVAVELLAFVDEDDNARDESVVLRFAASSQEVSPDQTLAEATLDVSGSNGTFSCTWSAASEALSDEGDGGTVESAGSCVDEDGEVFDWSATARAR